MSTVSFEIKVSLKFKDRRINRHKKKKLARCNGKRRVDELSVTVPTWHQPQYTTRLCEEQRQIQKSFQERQRKDASKGD